MVSDSGIQAKVQAAQEKSDTVLGVKKEDVTERNKALNAEQAKAIQNDTIINQSDQLKKELVELTRQIAAASGSLKDRLTTELTAKQQEVDLAKKNAETRKKEIEEEFKARRENIKEIKGLGTLRKEAMAEGMSNPGIISSDRVMFVGKVERSSLQAAANLRKGQKPIRDQLEDILKQGGELKKEEEKVEEAVKDNTEAAKESK